MDLYARLFGKTEVAASSDPIGHGLKEEPGISPSFLLIGRLVLKPRLNDRSGMNRGSADEAVVIVKFDADEFMVTWRRIKHRISDRRLEVKGGTRKRS